MAKRPHIMVGETGSRTMIASLRRLGWGRMYVEKRPKPYPEEKWGFDNGAFLYWTRNKPFDDVRFQQRLEYAQQFPKPYLAVTPDIVAAGLHSLDFSLNWRRKLPDSWPWYLAVQDGMEVHDVEPVISQFAGLFLGGTDRFKATAGRWCRLAHKHGKLFHYGRAGTPKKLLSAFKVGADSCDSAFPLWNNGRMDTFVRFWRNMEHQHTLEGIL